MSSLHVLSGSACFLSGFYGFLPQLKDLYVRQFRVQIVSRCECVWLCLSMLLCGELATFPGVSCLCPMTDGIGTIRPLQPWSAERSGCRKNRNHCSNDVLIFGYFCWDFLKSINRLWCKYIFTHLGNRYFSRQYFFFFFFFIYDNLEQAHLRQPTKTLGPYVRMCSNGSHVVSKTRHTFEYDNKKLSSGARNDHG